MMIGVVTNPGCDSPFKFDRFRDRGQGLAGAIVCGPVPIWKAISFVGPRRRGHVVRIQDRLAQRPVPGIEPSWSP